MTRAVISCDWTTNSTQCSKIARKNRETVLTWLRLMEARNELLPECGDGYVLTAFALGSAERPQGLWLASMRLDCNVKQGNKLTVQRALLTPIIPRVEACTSLPGSIYPRPSVMRKHARCLGSSRWPGSPAKLVLSNYPTRSARFPAFAAAAVTKPLGDVNQKPQLSRRTRGRGRDIPLALSSLYN
jgi:hypothetical protein